MQTDNPIDEISIDSNSSSTRKLKNVTALNIDIISSQIDFRKNYQNKSSLEMGAKYGMIENGSNVDFFGSDSDGSILVKDTSLSNQFNYQEAVTAGYLNFSGQLLPSLQYSVGLRSEFTSYELKLSQNDGLDISDTYLNFFPQASLTKLFSDNRSINLSYTSRIRRVPYQRLNPVLIYQDPYTSIQGNPESIPEKTQAIELNAKFNKTNFKLGYSYTTDPFGGGAIRGEDEKSYILIRLNFDETHRLFSSVSRTFETSWLSSTNTVSLRYTNINDRVFGFEDVPSMPNLYLYSNNRIPVRDYFNLEMSFYYLGDNNEGLYQRKNSWSLDVAVDRSFFNKALKCQLMLTDVFYSVRAAGDYSIAETDIYFGRKWNSNYLRLTVSYNFGKLKDNKYRNKEVGSSEKDRAN